MRASEDTAAVLASLDTRAADAEARALAAETRAAASEGQVRDAVERAREIETRARDIESRAKEAAERIVDAERRAREAQAQVQEARDRAVALQQEVDAAENVRQFAANTEREIAGLERELRETKTKLSQITLERDRFESQLRDARDDSETVNRDVRAARGSIEPPRRPSAALRGPAEPDLSRPRVDGEAGAPADLSRYTALVARASELEQKMVKIEREDEKLRRQLAEAQAKLEAQRRAQEDEPTSSKDPLPIQFVEQLGVLEEAIDSLRANMRAASDETAMMDQSDSVVAIAGAVSQAAEHVERARDALKVLTAFGGK
jgi:chromosome segregation ATPase